MPTNYQTTLVTGSPVGVSELNAAIVSLNAATYWVTDIKFPASPGTGDTAILLALEYGAGALGFSSDQKVVGFTDPTQGDLDASHATELTASFYPTGVFVSPAGTVFVLYQRLGIVGAP